MVMAEASSNFGNAQNVRTFAGWGFFQKHGEAEVISLGYTQDGISTEISADSEGVEADQSASPIITTMSNVSCGVTTPLMEWTLENMELAFPGAVRRTDAQGKGYIAMTSALQNITGTLRFHPTTLPDNDHSQDTFYTNVTPSPNLSITMDGTAAQLLPIEWVASPGVKPYAEQDGDTAYFNHMPASAIVHVTSIAITPTASLTLAVNATAKLDAVVTPEYATDKKVTWSSSDTDVVTVSEDGSLFAVDDGTATITATSRDGAKTATKSITVS
jgi:uncharacterized protein YjdB